MEVPNIKDCYFVSRFTSMKMSRWTCHTIYSIHVKQYIFLIISIDVGEYLLTYSKFCHVINHSTWLSPCGQLKTPNWSNQDGFNGHYPLPNYLLMTVNLTRKWLITHVIINKARLKIKAYGMNLKKLMGCNLNMIKSLDTNKNYDLDIWQDFVIVFTTCWMTFMNILEFLIPISLYLNKSISFSSASICKEQMWHQR